MKKTTLLMFCVGVLSGAFAEEIDITKVVREAGKGTPKLEQGQLAAGTVNNAFGEGMTKDDRVLLKAQANTISWSIASDFEPGKSIIVTRYVIRRAVYASDGENDISRERAPKDFRLEGSTDGSSWIPLDSHRNVDWPRSTDSMSFEFAPLYMSNYRHYRIVITATKRNEESCNCSFQFIQIFGEIGSEEPVLKACRKVDHLVSNGEAALKVADCMPTLDSKIELDVSFAKLSGNVGIFAASRYGEKPEFRLFHTDNDGWLLYYGDKSFSSGIKGYPGVRYKIVAAGPVVTVNGVKVIDREEEKLTSATTSGLSVLATQNGDSLNNLANARIWSVKVTDAAGNLKLDLRPYHYRDGGGWLYDAVGKKFYSSAMRDSRLKFDFRIDSRIEDVTAAVRETSSPTITMVEGEAHPGYPKENLFTSGQTLDDRAFFMDKHNVIQYDIPETFRPGVPVVLTRLAIFPAVGTEDSEMSCGLRGPTDLELQASVDGTTWVSLLKRTLGLGESSYKSGEYKKVTDETWGYSSFCLNIPEEARGNYRHYRFITNDSNSQAEPKVSVQEVRFYGLIGGAEPRYDPIGFVQNAYEKNNPDNTYFKTGVSPAKADLTIEITGEFTSVADTHALFCSRGVSNAKPWVAWLTDGKLRLDCDTAQTASPFAPQPNTPYTIKIVGNKMYVNGGDPICTSGTTDFAPGGEIYLLSSHIGGESIKNQARFKLRSCKITDAQGGVVRDYIPVSRSTDGVAGLFDRVSSTFLPSAGTAPKKGERADIDFRQRGRTVAMTSELEDGVIGKSVDFSFGENQILPATLYAAYADRIEGGEMEDWDEVRELGVVTSGVDALTAAELEKENGRKYVKFFLRDSLGACSQTRAYKHCRRGFVIMFR